MKSKDGEAEDDSAEIEELLAELDEDDCNSRYDDRHSSNDSHLDISIMHTEDSKFSNTHDNEEERTCDAPHAHLHLRTDASKNTMADSQPTSPSKFSHTHHREMRFFAVDMPPSPPPSPPPCGCSCFLLPSHKRVKNQKKSSGEDQSRKSEAKIQNGKASDNDDDAEWRSVFKETRPQEMDAGGLFDVKNTEREFKRASMKEKQLTQEAQNLLNMVASS